MNTFNLPEITSTFPYPVKVEIETVLGLTNCEDFVEDNPLDDLGPILLALKKKTDGSPVAAAFHDFPDGRRLIKRFIEAVEVKERSGKLGSTVEECFKTIAELLSSWGDSLEGPAEFDFSSCFQALAKARDATLTVNHQACLKVYTADHNKLILDISVLAFPDDMFSPMGAPQTALLDIVMKFGEKPFVDGSSLCAVGKTAIIIGRTAEYHKTIRVLNQIDVSEALADNVRALKAFRDFEMERVSDMGIEAISAELVAAAGRARDKVLDLPVIIDIKDHVYATINPKLQRLRDYLQFVVGVPMTAEARQDTVNVEDKEVAKRALTVMCLKTMSSFNYFYYYLSVPFPPPPLPSPLSGWGGCFFFFLGAL